MSLTHYYLCIVIRQKLGLNGYGEGFILYVTSICTSLYFVNTNNGYKINVVVFVLFSMTIWECRGKCIYYMSVTYIHTYTLQSTRMCPVCLELSILLFVFRFLIST